MTQVAKLLDSAALSNVPQVVCFLYIPNQEETQKPQVEEITRIMILPFRLHLPRFLASLLS